MSRVVRKSMNNISKKYIDIIMSDGEIRNVAQILDALCKNKISSIPTRGELSYYMSKNYSSEVRRERHPLALPGMRKKNTKVVYYWRRKRD